MKSIVLFYHKQGFLPSGKTKGQFSEFYHLNESLSTQGRIARVGLVREKAVSWFCNYHKLNGIANTKLYGFPNTVSIYSLVRLIKGKGFPE
jgi:hypothetical protein